MKRWKTKDAQITLMLGDARRILPRLESESVDLVFTDPPYGHNNNDGDLIAIREKALGRGQAGPPRPIAGDDPESAQELFRWLVAEARRLLRNSCCCCCCCGGGGPDPQFARWALWMDEVLSFKQMVVWDKGPMGMGWHYRRSYETVLVGQRGKGKCAWFDETRRVENIIRPGTEIRKIIPSKAQHPTAKPWRLAAHFIKLHTRRGELVVDPFMGAGSTAVAAVHTGRKFFGVEIEPEFFEQAVAAVKAARRDLREVAA